MQGLVQLYNGLSTQIQSTQSNLNILYRRMEVVERALVERFSILDTPSNTPITQPSTPTSDPPNTPTSDPPSNTSTGASVPTRYTEDPYSYRIEPSIITPSGNRRVMSFDASSRDDTTTASSTHTSSFSTNNSRPRDNRNIRFHIRSPTSEESLSSAIFEDIIMAFLRPSASEEAETATSLGISEEDRTRCLTYNEFRNIDMPTTHVCPITMDRFEPTTKIIRLNKCGHLFSEAGLLPWLSIRRHCPVCRALIL